MSANKRWVPQEEERLLDQLADFIETEPATVIAAEMKEGGHDVTEVAGRMRAAALAGVKQFKQSVPLTQERDAPKRDLDNMTEAAKFFRKERDALRAEVERLKGDYNVLLDDCIDMRWKLAQARRDALEEAACEAEGAHVNDERSDIAIIIRALADKD